MCEGVGGGRVWLKQVREGVENGGERQVWWADREGRWEAKTG